MSRTERLAEYAEYDRLNPTVMGTDMDYLMKSPWFAGAIHETTKSILVRPPQPLSLAEQDAYVDNHERYRKYFMAQGALLRKVCRENGKIFGAFARSQYFTDHGPLTPEGFARGFDRTIPLLEPDIVATIGPWFVDGDRLAEKYRSVIPGKGGELQDVWLERKRNYREQYKMRTAQSAP